MNNISTDTIGVILAISAMIGLLSTFIVLKKCVFKPEHTYEDTATAFVFLVLSVFANMYPDYLLERYNSIFDVLGFRMFGDTENSVPIAELKVMAANNFTLTDSIAIPAVLLLVLLKSNRYLSLNLHQFLASFRNTNRPTGTNQYGMFEYTITGTSLVSTTKFSRGPMGGMYPLESGIFFFCYFSDIYILQLIAGLILIRTAINVTSGTLTLTEPHTLASGIAVRFHTVFHGVPATLLNDIRESAPGYSVCRMTYQDSNGLIRRCLNSDLCLSHHNLPELELIPGECMSIDMPAPENSGYQVGDVVRPFSEPESTSEKLANMRNVVANNGQATESSNSELHKSPSLTDTKEVIRKLNLDE